MTRSTTTDDRLREPRPEGLGQKGILVVLGACLGLGIVETGQVYVAEVAAGIGAGHHGSFLGTAWRVLPSWLILAALVPGILVLSGRFPFERGRLARSLPVHIGVAIGFTIVHLAATAVTGMMGPITPARVGLMVGALARTYFVFDLVTYAAIVGADHLWRYHRRLRERETAAARLEASLSEARLDALRAQLDPHFLFNTLNGVSALVLEGEREAAADALGRLAELLRLTLDGRRRQEILLREELAIVDAYVGLVRTRFGDRLEVLDEVDPAALDALVPSMLLQPLVENAVVHGVAPIRGPGRVTIRARRVDGRIELAVEDTGPGFSEPGGRDGIGLSNTQARLEQLYGPAQELTLGVSRSGGASVRVSFPYRPGPPPEPAS